MDYNSDFAKDETIDIKKFVFKILANWYWFAITIFIALTITFYTNRYSDPIYKISASVLVTDKDNSLTAGVESIIQELGVYKKIKKKNVENEIGILHSYSMANRTVKELNFEISYFSIGRIRTPERYQTSPFIVNIDSAFSQLFNHPVYITLLSIDKYQLMINDEMGINQTMQFGEQFKNEYFNFNITLRDSDNFELDAPNYPKENYFIIHDLNQLTNRYKNKLSITTSDKKSSILILTTQGYVPRKEADYLNKLLQVYVNTGLEEKNQIAINTIEFIDKQLKIITDSLNIAENILYDFRRKNKIIDISQEGNAIFKKIEAYESEKALFEVKSKYYNYLRNYIEQAKDFKKVVAPSVMGIEDPLLNSLVVELNELYSTKNAISYSSTEKNPSIGILESKITSTKEKLLENLSNIINSTNISSTELNKRIEKVDIEIQKLPLTEKQLINIQRKFDLNDNIYTYLLEKRTEAGIAKASNIAENKILDIARPENAVLIAPKKNLNYIISLIIGILIPLIIIILKDFFNDKITEHKDVEDNTKIPILGSIGHNSKGVELIVNENPKSSISESFRSLRTNLQYLLIEKENHTITISSTVSGEGKTFCAVNLASIIASANKKTLIMGFDLRKPKLHKVLNTSNDVGLSNYLINKCSLDEIILPSGVENLDFIPSGPIPPNPAELIETKKMENLISELKQKYDYIIMDTPPIALVTDALLLSKFADTNIFVVRQNYSRKGVLKFVNDLYDQKNFTSLGILINDVKTPSYYGYGYKYGYGYDYGYGYYEENDQKETVKDKISKRIKRNS